MDKTGRIHSAEYSGYCVNANKGTEALTLNPCLDIDDQMWIERKNSSGNTRYECKKRFAIGNAQIECIDSGGFGQNLTVYPCGETSGNQNFVLPFSKDNNNYLAYMNDNLLAAVINFLKQPKE